MSDTHESLQPDEITDARRTALRSRWPSACPTNASAEKAKPSSA